MARKKLFACGACKHSFTLHVKYCEKKGCLCMLSFEDLGHPSTVEHEKARIDAQRGILRKTAMKYKRTLRH